MPASAISAALTALTAPMTLRLTQGTSTSPATGSQTRPIRFFSAMATAWPICSPLAAPQGDQRARRHGGRRADLRLTAAGSAGDARPVGDDRADAGGDIQRLEQLVLRSAPRICTAAAAPPAARRRRPPWAPPRCGAYRRWTPPCDSAVGDDLAARKPPVMALAAAGSTAASSCRRRPPGR